MRNQNTIAQEVKLKGTGLHSGMPVNLSLKPAPAGSGCYFRRADLNPDVTVQAHISNVGPCSRSTTLEHDGIRIRTVEHLLAAASALELDNLEITLDAEELPALDGSALKFLQVLQSAGRQTQPTPCQAAILTHPVWLKEGEALIFASPSPHFKLNYLAYFPHPQIGAQWLEFESGRHDFGVELAPAKTFCFWEEIEALKARNLGLGGDLSNVFVVKPDGYLGDIRFKDEVVRHKALDFIGDLTLLGRPFMGEIHALRTSHQINVNFIAKLNEVLKLN